MKKFCLMLICLLIPTMLVLGGCSSQDSEHNHIWSAICGEHPSCIICGVEQEGDVVIEHSWTQEVCEQRQFCIRCGIANDHVVEHDYQTNDEDKMECTRCHHELQEDDGFIQGSIIYSRLGKSFSMYIKKENDNSINQDKVHIEDFYVQAIKEHDTNNSNDYINGYFYQYEYEVYVKGSVSDTKYIGYKVYLGVNSEQGTSNYQQYTVQDDKTFEIRYRIFSNVLIDYYEPVYFTLSNN